MIGRHLRIVKMGEAVLGVKLEGLPTKPEPIHFRLTFPGGDVDVTRTTDDNYWIHVNVFHPESPRWSHLDTLGLVTDLRADTLNKSAHESSIELHRTIPDFGELDHFAAHVTRVVRTR